VNAKNPLASISLSQLDAIYGSGHRAAPANIRTWGELGLTGEWTTQPIHAYGFGPEDALGVFFRHDVLLSDFKPNPRATCSATTTPVRLLLLGVLSQQSQLIRLPLATRIYRRTHRPRFWRSLRRMRPSRQRRRLRIISTR